MDCETFDRDVLDLVYEDGDDAAREALALHAASCARCGATLGALRLGRDQAARLPRVAPPEGLTRKILAREAEARSPAPLSRRVARAASWAGSLAMRPQFAMAALFCLAVGSSLLLLRADSMPGPTSIREEGLPSPEEPTAAQAPSPTAPGSPPRAAARAEPVARSDSERRARPTEEGAAEATAPADAPSEAPKAAGDRQGAAEALASALERLQASGCGAALDQLRAVANDFGGTDQAARAAREIEGCSQLAAARAAPAAAPPPAASGGAGASAPRDAAPAKTAPSGPAPR